MWFEHSSASCECYQLMLQRKWLTGDFPQESGWGPWECSGLLGLWCSWTDGGTRWTWRSLPTVMILRSKGLNLTSTPRARGSSSLSFQAQVLLLGKISLSFSIPCLSFCFPQHQRYLCLLPWCLAKYLLKALFAKGWCHSKLPVIKTAAN